MSNSTRPLSRPSESLPVISDKVPSTKKKTPKEEEGTAVLSNPDAKIMPTLTGQEVKVPKKIYETKKDSPETLKKRQEMIEQVEQNPNYTIICSLIRSSMNAEVNERPKYALAAKRFIESILKDYNIPNHELEEVSTAISLKVVESDLADKNNPSVDAFEKYLEAASQDPEFWDTSLKQKVKRIENEILVGTINEDDAINRVRQIVESAIDNTITQGTTILFSIPKKLPLTQTATQEPSSMSFEQNTPKIVNEQASEDELQAIGTENTIQEMSDLFPELREREIVNGEKVLEVKIPPDARFIRKNRDGKIEKQLSTTKHVEQYKNNVQKQTNKLFEEIMARVGERRRLLLNDDEARKALELLQNGIKEGVSEEEYNELDENLNLAMQKASIRDVQELLRKRRGY